MKNAMKINKKEVFFGAVSGAIVAVGGTIISHILSNKAPKNGIEVVKKETEKESVDGEYIMGFDVSSGEDMSGNPVESEEN